jgi:hypothetical protein
VLAVIDRILNLISALLDRQRHAREAQQARLVQIHAREAAARYQLDQLTLAARQAILDAATRKSS